MKKNVKAYFRENLPMRYQVPLKYAYSKARGFLEPELGILNLIVNPGDLVVDVGANRGIYTYRLWQLGARIEAFEPNQECFGILSAWAKGRDRVNLHNLALSNKSGYATLHIPVDIFGVEHDSSASIEPIGRGAARDQSVAISTLDSFAFQDVILVKIDVEGHEHKIIDGAKRTLAASKPALLVEIEERHNGRPVVEMFEKIRGFGYRGYFMQNRALQRIEEFQPTTYQNCHNTSVCTRYVNNFIFLGEEAIVSGKYESLLRRGSSS
jgi:FkbM family methyltransferase